MVAGDDINEQLARAIAVQTALELMIEYPKHATATDLLDALALCGLVLKPGETIRRSSERKTNN